MAINRFVTQYRSIDHVWGNSHVFDWQAYRHTCRESQTTIQTELQKSHHDKTYHLPAFRSIRVSFAAFCCHTLVRPVHNGFTDSLGWSCIEGPHMSCLNSINHHDHPSIPPHHDHHQTPPPTTIVLVFSITKAPMINV